MTLRVESGRCPFTEYSQRALSLLCPFREVDLDIHDFFILVFAVLLSANVQDFL